MTIGQGVSVSNVGILMHIRHLNTVGWEQLVWGVPENDSLGSLPKVVELLLTENGPINTIVFGCGPSTKNGLSEGEYTKQFLLEHVKDLHQFPRLAPLLTPKKMRMIRSRLQKIIITPTIDRSIDEVRLASEIFTQHNVVKVIQVTAASHAPRCIQIQAAARAAGLIPARQQWFVMADDRCYADADPFSTLILEPPHRGDDPMLDFDPSLHEVMREYQYGLSPTAKKGFIRLAADFIKENGQPSNIRKLH